jgi:hypothetical protein
MRVLLLVGEALFAKTAPAGRIKMALHELFTEIIIMQQPFHAGSRSLHQHYTAAWLFSQLSLYFALAAYIYPPEGFVRSAKLPYFTAIST